MDETPGIGIAGVSLRTEAADGHRRFVVGLAVKNTLSGARGAMEVNGVPNVVQATVWWSAQAPCNSWARSSMEREVRGRVMRKQAAAAETPAMRRRKFFMMGRAPGCKDRIS